MKIKKFTDFIVENGQTTTKPDVRPTTKPGTKPGRPSPIPSTRPSVSPDPKAKLSKSSEKEISQKFMKAMKKKGESISKYIKK